MNVDAPILRVHTHTAWVSTCEAKCSPNVDACGYPASPTIWATTRTRHGRPSQRHRCPSTHLQRAHDICERPDEPKHIHADPRKSTRTHEVLGSQSATGLPRFGQFWPQLGNSGQPRHDHEVLGVHHAIWASTESLGSWTPTCGHELSRPFWASTHLYGRP